MNILRRLRNLWALSTYRVEQPKVGTAATLVPALVDERKPKKKPAVIVETKEINHFPPEHDTTS